MFFIFAVENKVVQIGENMNLIAPLAPVKTSWE